MLNEKIVYLIIASAIVIIDIWLSISIFRKGDKNQRKLGFAMLASAVIELSYSASIVVKSYFAVKFLLGIFFLGSAVILFLLFQHVQYITQSTSLIRRRTHVFVGVLVIFDALIQMINPFKEIVVSYSYVPENIMHWQYHPHVLYYVHIGFCCLLVFATFYYIVKKIITLPSVYRQKFYTLLNGFSLAILINVACLAFETYGLLDYSQVAYCIIGVVFYIDMFQVNQNGQLGSTRQMVIDKLEHPLVLFGSDNILTIQNEISEAVFDDLNNAEKTTFDEFIKKYQLDTYLTNYDKPCHFQWHYTKGTNKISYRVDYNVLTDKNNRIIGRLFVFSDTSLETDLLTGIASKNAFKRHFADPTLNITYPVAVAICDINGLSLINKKYGHDVGDRCIRRLSQTMKRICPEGSYLARLDNADLLVVIQDCTPEDVKKYLKDIQKDFSSIKDPENFEIQSAFISVSNKKTSICDAMKDAEFSMRSRKMMDGTSAHSSLLDSLAQALMENDETTKAHVFRTQELGEMLAEHLGLSDLDQSNLSLICLLHDIGKLAIPLEILNKPGTLSTEEWDIMKSHVNKGYRITRVSRELESIADYILHHHEAWDGSGYPDGLAKEDIPLLSRIIAIIDAYDAMVNDRPYHKAISEYDARNELKRCAGKQFDPYLVSEFIHLMDKVKPLTVAEIYSSGRESITLPRGAYPLEDYMDEKVPTNASVNYSRFVIDQENRVIEIDSGFTDITGYTSEDLSTFNLTQEDLIPTSNNPPYSALIKDTKETDGSSSYEVKLKRKDGAIRPVICFDKPSYNYILCQKRREIIMADILNTNAVSDIRHIEQRKLQRNIEAMQTSMRKDSMTGLLNHTSFINDFEDISLSNPKSEMMLLILDVDKFKEYNDTYGHLYGDVLLKKIASILSESVMKYQGFAGRLGGDEFAAVLPIPGVLDNDIFVQKIYNDIFEALIAELQLLEKSATVSVGVAVSTNSKRRFHDLYMLADKALYESKDAGRNKITLSKEI